MSTTIKKQLTRAKTNKDETATSETKKHPKPKKVVPSSPTSTRVTKTQYYPDTKSIISKAVGTPKVKPSMASKPSAMVPPASRAVKPQPKPKPSLAEVKKEMRQTIKRSTLPTKTPGGSSGQAGPGGEERPRTATLKRPSIVSTNVVGPEAIRFKKIAKAKDSNKVDKKRSDSIKTVSDLESEDATIRTITTESIASSIVTSKEEEEDEYEDDFDSYASDDFEAYESSASSPVDVSTDGEVTSSEDEEPEEQPTKRVSSAEEERKLDSGNFDLPIDELKTRPQTILDQIKEHEPTVALSSLSDEGFDEASKLSSLQFVNFADAKRKSVAKKKQEKTHKRGEELMSMIRLDQQNFTLFDLPTKTYDEYIKSFGQRNTTQIAVQTGEDRIAEEVQTDQINVSNKWTQFPIDKITKSKDPSQFREELLGVGSDTNPVMDMKNILDSAEYNEYNLSKFLLMQERLIGELLKENQYGSTIEMTTGKFPFSQGYLILNTEKLGVVRLIAFSASSKNPKVITIHAEVNQGKSVKNKGFVWSLLKPTMPEDNFSAFGVMSDVVFGLENDKLIFGGFTNGSLAVWDLLEDIPHQDSRPPSYLSDIDLGQAHAIVRVVCCRLSDNSIDFQVITLDEIGTIITWGLILKPTASLGLNRVSLVKNKVFKLQQQHPDLQLLCTDLCLNSADPNHLYISTNYGLILHALSSGARTNPKRFNTGLQSGINTLEACPHNANYFLAGSDSGEVVLLSKHFERPLMAICNQQTSAAIRAVQWSRTRPCIFFTLDADDNINVWDLSVSELFPACAVHLKEGIKTMRVSPRKADTSYLAVVTADGRVHLHLFNQEHAMQEVEVYDGDLRKLNNYVQRL